MAELRKLIKLTHSVYAVTLPNKYRESLGLQTGDYVSVSLWEKDKILLMRQPIAKKS